MLIRRPADIKPSEITPERHYLNRRELMFGVAGSSVLGSSLLGALGAGGSTPAAAAVAALAALRHTKNPKYAVDDKLNTHEEIAGYNNFYEFGLDKGDPAANAHTLKPTPWSVEIAGEAGITGKFTIEDILKPHALEERVYRFRCVEAWSMVIPWVGFPLGDLLKRFQPNAKAKYVEFRTLHDPKQMPGQRSAVLDWPYVEGLRIDEAMHPLTLMAVGLYGRVLPNQNGAPLRLMAPWKYGFKNIKSIVSIRFTERQPRNTWNVSAPNEYGFYANVNPAVDHPRWSQATERRIGDGLFAGRRPTLPFNGYAEQVASLYTGLDLKRNF